MRYLLGVKLAKTHRAEIHPLSFSLILMTINIYFESKIFALATFIYKNINVCSYCLFIN